jgi:predicted RNA polymerase sigma factor
LGHYPFYPAAIAEFERRRGNLDEAREHFSTAARLARSPVERRYLEARVRECGAERIRT